MVKFRMTEPCTNHSIGWFTAKESRNTGYLGN